MVVALLLGGRAVHSKLGLGSTYRGEERCDFSSGPPLIRRVEVHILSPEEHIVPREVPRGHRPGGHSPVTAIIAVEIGNG